MTHTQTTAESVVKTLVNNGVDTIFGIPGGHSFPMYAAISKQKGLRHVLGRHEQGLGYMAEGYFRGTGKIAAVSITSGPAVANIAAAMGQATTDTANLLVIASTPRAELVGKNRYGLHDLGDSLDIAKSVCRYAEHASTPAEAVEKCADLIYRMKSSRAGAAYLQIPTDVMAQLSDVEAQTHEPLQPICPEPSLIAKAADWLIEAERPLILLGTGAMNSGAGEAISEIAGRLAAVVSSSSLARGTVSCELPGVIFPDGAPPWSATHEVFNRADVVLAIGTMFKQEDTCDWQVKMGSKLIHIDIDPAEFGRSYTPDLAINADARLAAEAILEQLGGLKRECGEWISYAQAQQASRFAKRHEDQGEDMKFIEDFRSACPPGAQLYFDRCNIGYWAYRCMPFYEPRTFHYPMGYGGLGGSLPQAFGAKLANPDHRVVSVIGDGGLQFTLPELAVAVQEKIPVTIVITNNHCYGAIRAGLSKNYDGLEFGTAISSPDYASIAKAYGIPYQLTESHSVFLDSFREELTRDRLNIIEFRNQISDP